MGENIKYRFINCETGNVIYYISMPYSECAFPETLENIRRKLAYEKNMYVEKIYYTAYSETDFEE